MNPMTQHGYNLIVNEIKLLDEKRPKMVKAIEIAKEHGDLKENAEYHSAKEELRIIDSQLAELQTSLATAKVIDPTQFKHDRVSFGSTVKVMNINTKQEFTYIIVGTIESNPSKNRISFKTPMAKALLGKEEGDDFDLNLGAEVKSFEILSVEYKEIDFGN